MKLIDADNLGLTDFEIVICDGDYKEVLKLLLSKIENAPIVNAVPVRHGKWIPCMMDSRGFADMFKCSECKRYSYYAYGVKHLDYKYCPHCGAKMDGERKEE